MKADGKVNEAQVSAPTKPSVYNRRCYDERINLAMRRRNLPLHY